MTKDLSTQRILLASVACWTFPAVLACVSAASLPENLAARAKVTASSEYDEHYQARFAVDGKIPRAGRRSDANRVWAVQGSTAKDRATFTLEWADPVAVAEVVYYGRTAFLSGECWRDYALYLDNGAKPVASGRFQRAHGPQRIALARTTRARKLVLKFLNSFGGANPGASEIQVFAVHAPPEALGKLRRLRAGSRRPVLEVPEEPELARRIAEHRLGFDTLLFIQRHPLNPSHVYTTCCEGFRPGGGISRLSPPARDGKVTQLLASPAGQILDMDLSCDGREIVFSWKRSADAGYHIFRINADGTGLTQLTHGEWHDYNACWLPDGGIAFVSTRATANVLCFHTPSGVLFRMDRDGDAVRRLSDNYVNDFTPSVMPDGRILYSRWEYVDKPAIPIQSLWTIHPDGTGVRAFYGNRVLSPASFLDARAIPGRDTVMCTLTSHNGPIRGAVGLVDRARGVNAQSALTNLTPDVDIGTVDAGDGNRIDGPYETPNPIDARRYIVSCDGALMLGEIGGGMATIYTSPDELGCYDGTVLGPRPVPPVLRRHKSDTQTAAASTHGKATVYLVDVYRGLEPYVPRGTVKALRIVQEIAKNLRTHSRGYGFQTPVISCGATYAVKQVWGTVPVAEDGSAYFTVPAGRPLYFIALDADGVAVQRMRSFTHFRAGETVGCIGCHEPRNTTPPHLGARAALRGVPDAIEPPSWGVTHFDYIRHVQPVLDQYCVGCHNGREPAGGVDLSADRTDWFCVSYDVLTRRFVNWIDTRNGCEANILQVEPLTWGSPKSKLTKLLLRGHPDADGKPRITMDADRRTRILTWIDLNVPYYATYDMADEARRGGRRLYPKGLRKKLAEVWSRRCERCHEGRRPTPGYVRITNPQRNPFLAAPLARDAGGRGACGAKVFASTDDPDYRALLALFEPIRASLKARPRVDMPGARPALVSRSRK